MRVVPRLHLTNARAAAAGFIGTLALAALVFSPEVLARASAAFARMGQMVEGEVVLLFVPLCALVFAIAIEVMRMTGSGSLPDPRPATRLPRSWRDGAHSP